MSSSYVVPKFLKHRYGENYDWAYKLLGLHHAEVIDSEELRTTFPNLTIIPACPYDKLILNSSSICNVHFVVSGYGCCDNGNCFYDSVMAGVYEYGKNCLRWKRRHGSVFDSDSLNIVWHIRTGDIDLHLNDSAFFETVAGHINKGLSGFTFSHNIVYDGESSPTPSPPSGFDFLTRVLPNCKLLPTKSSEISYRIMEAADVLITTGSSFAEAALLSSIKSSQTLRIHHVPKHHSDTGYGASKPEYLSDVVVVFRNGSLSVDDQELSRLATKLFCGPSSCSGRSSRLSKWKACQDVSLELDGR